MKILYLNEFQNPVTQNLIHFFSEKLGIINFNWTGKRWYREDFLPFTTLEEHSYIHEPLALTRLTNGYYDFVIFTDSTTYIYLSNHLKNNNTKRIFIDSTDSYIIPRSYWENSEIYFKCQYRKDNFYIANNNELNKPIKLTETEIKNKLYPFSLTPSFKVIKNYYSKLSYKDNKNFDVFFNGSAWPKDRIKCISLLKNETDLIFYGGLYNRDDLEFNNIVPDKLRSKPFNLSHLISCINNSKININLKGNGDNCYRQFEILYLGEFLLTQKNKNNFGHIQPIDNVHCGFFNENFDDLIDKIYYYLNNNSEIIEISKKGKEFFENNYHPSKLVEYIIINLEKYL